MRDLGPSNVHGVVVAGRGAGLVFLCAGGNLVRQYNPEAGHAHVLRAEPGERGDKAQAEGPQKRRFQVGCHAMKNGLV